MGLFKKHGLNKQERGLARGWSQIEGGNKPFEMVVKQLSRQGMIDWSCSWQEALIRLQVGRFRNLADNLGAWADARDPLEWVKKQIELLSEILAWAEACSRAPLAGNISASAAPALLQIAEEVRTASGAE